MHSWCIEDILMACSDRESFFESPMFSGFSWGYLLQAFEAR